MSDLKTYTDSVNRYLISLISQPYCRVLDVGCWTGAMGSHLLENNLADIVVGVDRDPEALFVADKRISFAVEMDLNQPDFSGSIFKDQFDLVVLGDVLEHLVDPGAMLQQIKPLIRSDSQIVFSIPNVQNIVVLTDLIQGRFTYSGKGILDQTHLRFFTKQSIDQLFYQNGFAIETLKSVVVPPAQIAAFYPKNSLNSAVLEAAQTAYEKFTSGEDCQSLISQLLGTWNFNSQALEDLFAKQFYGTVVLGHV